VLGPGMFALDQGTGLECWQCCMAKRLTQACAVRWCCSWVPIVTTHTHTHRLFCRAWSEVLTAALLLLLLCLQVLELC
jgi:hypothetical protein